jgi:hypothetical protein
MDLNPVGIRAKTKNQSACDFAPITTSKTLAAEERVLNNLDFVALQSNRAFDDGAVTND